MRAYCACQQFIENYTLYYRQTIGRKSSLSLYIFQRLIFKYICRLWPLIRVFLKLLFLKIIKLWSHLFTPTRVRDSHCTRAIASAMLGT